MFAENEEEATEQLGDVDKQVSEEEDNVEYQPEDTATVIQEQRQACSYQGCLRGWVQRLPLKLNLRLNILLLLMENAHCNTY